MEFTNLKAALSNVGLMHWGERSRTSKFEAHDLIGGPAAEVFGEAEVSETLVTCRTSNVQTMPCETAHYSGGVLVAADDGAYECQWFDERFFRSSMNVVKWSVCAVSFWRG